MNIYDDSDLENRIAIALHERARALPELSVWPVAAAEPVPDAPRGRTGRRVLVGAVTVALAASVAVVADRDGSHGTIRVSAPPSSAPHPTAGDAAQACPAITPVGEIANPDAGLEAICLPAPAPGFPLRRTADALAMQDGAQTATFLVGVTPPTRTTEPNGAIVSTPTGPEATVFVARAGSFATSPADAPYPVVGTTRALGATATIVNAGDGEIGVLVSADGFAIAAYGQGRPDGVAVSPAQLVALIDSLQGLPTS